MIIYIIVVNTKDNFKLLKKVNHINSMRINGHGHILPEPSQIPKFMKEKKLFWIDDNKKFMRQDNWARPITSSSFFKRRN